MSIQELERVLATAHAEEEHREAAAALILEGVEKINAGLAMLTGGKNRKPSAPRANGRGVSTDKAREYAEALRQENPKITQEELEARVSARARKDGLSTRGLVTRLRRALSQRAEASR